MKKRLSRPVTILTLALAFFFNFSLFAQEIPTDEAAIKAGEALFNGNCKSCHRVKQKLVGPALAGVEDRAPSVAWIISLGA
jgi:mono/diheme cytochrome c family protein